MSLSLEQVLAKTKEMSAPSSEEEGIEGFLNMFQMALIAYYKEIPQYAGWAEDPFSYDDGSLATDFRIFYKEGVWQIEDEEVQVKNVVREMAKEGFPIRRDNFEKLANIFTAWREQCIEKRTQKRAH